MTHQEEHIQEENTKLLTEFYEWYLVNSDPKMTEICDFWLLQICKAKRNAVSEEVIRIAKGIKNMNRDLPVKALIGYQIAKSDVADVIRSYQP